MPKKIFISYSHRQGPWVWDRLVPCLEAGGCEVLIDLERFEAGKALVGQMDATQDEAEASVLVLSPEYLKSKACRHEMKRAVDRDPSFEDGSVIPVMRRKCTLPPSLRGPNPLYVDLQNDKKSESWDLLLSACDGSLGVEVPHWLEVRSEVRQLLERGESVNLVVLGDCAWRPLIEDLGSPGLGIVDLQRGTTASRRGLVKEMLRSLGATVKVPAEPEDLGELDRFFDKSPKQVSIALVHFDLAARRDYGVDLYGALRYHLSESRRLVLLIQSRRPLPMLLPEDHPLSTIHVSTVELRGRS